MGTLSLTEWDDCARDHVVQAGLAVHDHDAAAGRYREPSGLRHHCTGVDDVRESNEGPRPRLLELRKEPGTCASAFDENQYVPRTVTHRPDLKIHERVVSAERVYGSGRTYSAR